MKGNQIGIFGQESHWKLEPLLFEPGTPDTTRNHSTSNKSLVVPSIELNSQSYDNLLDSSSLLISANENNEENLLHKLNEKLKFESTFNFENDAFVNDTTLRYNPWSKTILGKCYQETRAKKRDRKQPGLINSEEYDIWEKTGQAPGGLYGSLQIVELEPVKTDSKKNMVRHAPHLFEYKQPEKNLAESCFCFLEFRNFRSVF